MPPCAKAQWRDWGIARVCACLGEELHWFPRRQTQSARRHRNGRGECNASMRSVPLLSTLPVFLRDLGPLEVPFEWKAEGYRWPGHTHAHLYCMLQNSSQIFMGRNFSAPDFEFRRFLDSFIRWKIARRIE